MEDLSRDTLEKYDRLRKGFASAEKEYQEAYEEYPAKQGDRDMAQTMYLMAPTIQHSFQHVLAELNEMKE